MSETTPKLYADPPARIDRNVWYEFRSGVLVCLSEESVDLRFERRRKERKGHDHVVCLAVEEAEAFLSFLKKFIAEAKRSQPKQASPPSTPPAVVRTPSQSSSEPLPAPVPVSVGGGSIFD